MNIRSIAAVFVFSLLAAFVVLPVDAENESKSPQFLLLKNGQVIECEIDQEASTEASLVIEKKSGSRIHLNRNKIVTVAASRSALYWDKCGLLSPTDSAGHMRLFDWCLAHHLLDSAQNQIELLQFMDVSPDRMLALVEKLDQATTRYYKKVQAEKFATRHLPKSIPSESADGDELDESNASNQIQQVGYEAPVEFSDRLKLIDRLERATDSIDGQAVVMFKRKIEPLLINSCYTAKCHSNDSMPLPLATLGKSQRMPRRMSQRNLYNVLKYTDFDRPLESKLLSAAALPHAGQTSPILKINSLQFQNLRIWLIGISSTPFIYHPVPDVFLESDTKVAVVAKDETSDADPGQPAKAPELDAAKKLPSAEKVSQNIVAAKQAAAIDGTKQETNPEDPFDPDRFNRLYLEKGKETTQESSESDPAAKKEDTGS